MQKQKSTNDLIDKINNVVNGIMKEEITEKMQSVLEMAFDKVKDKFDWKAPTLPLSFGFTFSNYESIIQTIGLIALAFSHFHGGYLLARVGNSDTVIIRSRGYYHYN